MHFLSMSFNIILSQVTLFVFLPIELNYENLMVFCDNSTFDTPEKAAIYTFLAKEPTMTNSRVEAMGTGSHPPYVKIAKSFKNSIVA